jgi:hypothetical protein
MDFMEEKRKNRLGMTAHTCNLSYSEVEIGRILLQGQYRKKFSETPTTTSTMPAILAT